MAVVLFMRFFATSEVLHTFTHIVIVEKYFFKVILMSEMNEMIKMLADAPEEQRQQMLTQRLKMIAGQPKEQRVKSLAGLITAVTELKEKKMNPFIATRTKIISEGVESCVYYSIEKK